MTRKSGMPFFLGRPEIQRGTGNKKRRKLKSKFNAKKKEKTLEKTEKHGNFPVTGSVE